MTHMAAIPMRELALSKAAQCLAEAHRLLRMAERPRLASMAHEVREELEREGVE